MWCGSIVNDELIKLGNIALHFRLNPSAGYALLNSRSGKTWGTEERTSRGRLPPSLLQNQRFKISITVEANVYRIDVNENTFVSFIHRHPYESVGLLSYDGDFEVDNVTLQSPPSPPGLAVAPSAPPPLPSMPPIAQTGDVSSHVLYDIKFPKLPFLLPIANGLSTGMSFLIDGQITGTRFDVSFYQGSNPYGESGCDVAFHMEVLLQEKVILRNSNQDNEWRKVEKEVSFFPFLGQHFFNMEIRVEANRYQVNVGGHYIFDFYHRITRLHTIDHICLHGGVSVSSLTITLPPL